MEDLLSVGAEGQRCLMYSYLPQEHLELLHSPVHTLMLTVRSSEHPKSYPVFFDSVCDELALVCQMS